MTFLRQIQMLLERTYLPIGINLEKCLVGRQRCTELSTLAGSHVQEMSHEGRTFLRITDGRLYLAIYYHPSVISALERYHPLKGLNPENIRPLIVFLEEVNHAIHAALLFLEGRFSEGLETVLCNLELQAKVDTYLALKLIVTVLRKRRYRLTSKHQNWLRHCLFAQESFAYKNSSLRHCYREANVLGLRLVCYLDNLEAFERVEWIREFRKLGFAEKRAKILALQ